MPMVIDQWYVVDTPLLPIESPVSVLLGLQKSDIISSSHHLLVGENGHVVATGSHSVPLVVSCVSEVVGFCNFLLHEHAGWSNGFFERSSATDDIEFLHHADERHLPPMAEDVAINIQKHDERMVGKEFVVLIDAVV